MLFIEIDPNEKYYSVSPSFGCFSKDELQFIEETLYTFWNIVYDELHPEEKLWEVEEK